MSYPADMQRVVAEFRVWLGKNMPPGTVISDPNWWADRIIRRLVSDRIESAQAIAPGGGAAATINDLNQPETPNVHNRGNTERSAGRVDGSDGYGRCAPPGSRVGTYGLGAEVLHDEPANPAEDRNHSGDLAATGVAAPASEPVGHGCTTHRDELIPHSGEMHHGKTAASSAVGDLHINPPEIDSKLIAEQEQAVELPSAQGWLDSHCAVASQEWKSGWEAARTALLRRAARVEVTDAMVERACLAHYGETAWRVAVHQGGAPNKRANMKRALTEALDPKE